MARPATPLVLTASEREALILLTKTGVHKSREIIRARALLLMDAGKSKSEVMSALSIDPNHYFRIKSRYLKGGLSDALEERPRSGQPPKITERLEAQITSLACSDSPAGTARWTLSLLNEKLVELEYVDVISDESIRKVLKKANLSPGKSECGVLAQ